MMVSTPALTPKFNSRATLSLFLPPPQPFLHPPPALSLYSANDGKCDVAGNWVIGGYNNNHRTDKLNITVCAWVGGGKGEGDGSVCVCARARACVRACVCSCV